MRCRWRNTIACFLLLTVSLVAQQGPGLVQIAPNTWTTNQRPLVVPWMPVKVNRLWGFADTTGQIKIAPQFDAVEPFNGGFAVIQKGNKAYVIDSSGTIVTPNGHDQIQQLEDSVFATYKNTSENGEGGWGADKYGGKEILAPRYDRISRISYFVFACHSDSGMGFFHRNGTLLTPANYDTGYVFTSKYISLISRNNYGVVSLSGTRVLPDSCEMIKILSPAVVAGKKKSGWGANNENGGNVIPFLYDSLAALSPRFALAKRNDTAHLYAVSVSPSKKVEGDYINATPYGAFWLKGYTKEKKCALIDTSGRVILPPEYDDILFAGNGNWIVVKNKMWGVCDSSGKIIVPLNYTFIQPFRQGMSVVSSGILQGLINAKGEVLVNPAQCVITIKGTIAKVMRPNAKAEFVKTDGNGNVTSRDEYEDVRTIKIGARPTPAPLPRGGGFSYGGGVLTIAPRGDSLAWFLDASVGLYGMMDTYLGDTLIQPSFTFYTRIGRGLTLVGIRDTFQSIALDGQILESGLRVGLIEDTSGKMIIRAQYTYLQPYNFSRNPDSMLFRCCRTDGASGLVSADGKERFIPASYVGFLMGGVAPFCIGGKWEMVAGGECRTTWSAFATQNNIVNNGPFRTFYESRNAQSFPVSHTGGKWGYIDMNGKVVIPPQYSSAQPSFEGTCRVRLDKKWGMIDTTGKQIIPFSFDMITYVFSGGSVMVKTQLNGPRAGCIDTLGNIVVPVQYKKVILLGKGLIAVTTAGKWGICSTTGEVIAEEKYTEIMPFSEGHAAVRTGRKWGLIDSTGAEILPPTYDAMSNFSSGLCPVKLALYWGYINTSGQLIVPCTYVAAGAFVRNTAPVRTRLGYGLIDRKGTVVVKATYQLIERISNTAMYSFKKDGALGLMSSTGAVIITPRYNRFKDLGYGRIACYANLRWGIVDTNGVVLSIPSFEKIGEFTNGLCPVAVESQWGYVGLNGKFRITPQFRAAAQFGDGLAYVVTTRSGSAFIDTTGTVRFSLTGKSGASVFCENKTMVRDKTTCSYYTRYGHRLTRIQFDDGLPFYHGAAAVELGNRWGLINFAGRYLVEPGYTHMSPFTDGVATVQLNAAYGLYSMKGKEILPAEYDVVKESGIVIRIQKNDRVGYLSMNGRIIWALQG